MPNEKQYTKEDVHALAARVGVSFADLIFFIRGMRERTGLDFNKVFAWVEKQPEQCKEICEAVRRGDPPHLAAGAAALDERIARERSS